jgi:hypothetical protein
VMIKIDLEWVDFMKLILAKLTWYYFHLYVALKVFSKDVVIQIQVFDCS